MNKTINVSSQENYCIGRLGEDKARKVVFEGVKGDNFFLLLNRNGVNFPAIPIPDGEWIVSNTYTQGTEPFTYRAEVVEIVDDEKIEKGMIYKFEVWNSLGNSKPTPLENVPANYEVAYKQMIHEREKIERMREAGEFNGETGPQGPQGLRGEKGERGEVGPKGERGLTGPQGPSMPVDDVMSDTSTNPVQNKIVKEYVDNRDSGIAEKEYELIDTIEIKGNDTTILCKSEEPNGVPYNFRKIMIKTILAKKQEYTRYNYQIRDAEHQYIFATFIGNIANGLFMCTFIDTGNHLLKAESAYSSSSYGIGKIESSTLNSLGEKIDSIKSLEISCGSVGKFIPENSIIEIWGVRA